MNLSTRRNPAGALSFGHGSAGPIVLGRYWRRLEQIRPAGLPAIFGIASENTAHRIAVTWEGAQGEEQEGVFIPRRDTNSLLNSFAGGRLFPGEHQRADFTVTDDGSRIEFSMRSRDGEVTVELRGSDSEALSSSSCFASLAECSNFFECGSLGYSITRDRRRMDGLRLETSHWQVAAMNVEHVRSSFFEDVSIFPAGSVEFDHTLIMRDVPHEWHQAKDMFTDTKAAQIGSH